MIRALAFLFGGMFFTLRSKYVWYLILICIAYLILSAIMPYLLTMLAVVLILMFINSKRKTPITKDSTKTLNSLSARNPVAGDFIKKLRNSGLEDGQIAWSAYQVTKYALTGVPKEKIATRFNLDIKAIDHYQEIEIARKTSVGPDQIDSEIAAKRRKVKIVGGIYLLAHALLLATFVSCLVNPKQVIECYTYNRGNAFFYEKPDISSKIIHEDKARYVFGNGGLEITSMFPERDYLTAQIWIQAKKNISHNPEKIQWFQVYLKDLVIGHKESNTYSYGGKAWIPLLSIPVDDKRFDKREDVVWIHGPNVKRDNDAWFYFLSVTHALGLIGIVLMVFIPNLFLGYILAFLGSINTAMPLLFVPIYIIMLKMDIDYNMKLATVLSTKNK